ncbi:hypothetical protein NUW54_g11658 [Trametes sanguinea]|uniref:Uncharacterized protein n=1 Tax=Trametes sanguinea TaxID=158606 RepID=A0ACC1NAS6_9APHY|nr:hypothetical protein NUW54_g11658 [Trametes sanguinea]
MDTMKVSARQDTRTLALITGHLGFSSQQTWQPILSSIQRSRQHTQVSLAVPQDAILPSPLTNRIGKLNGTNSSRQAGRLCHAFDNSKTSDIPSEDIPTSIGFLTLYLYASNGDPRKVVVALSVALAFIVPCDILRFRSARFEWLFERCVGFLMRESEKKTTNGVIWYIIGVIFVLSVLPLDIATVSTPHPLLADTAASYHRPPPWPTRAPPPPPTPPPPPAPRAVCACAAGRERERVLRVVMFLRGRAPRGTPADARDVPDLG